VDGLLVPDHDPAALAEAVERVLRDPELADRLGQAGRRRVAPHFDLARNTRRLRALFEGIAREDTVLEVVA
jgi:glycosyltransferase involved in cell wall biosynthesis